MKKTEFALVEEEISQKLNFEEQVLLVLFWYKLYYELFKRRKIAQQIPKGVSADLDSGYQGIYADFPYFRNVVSLINFRINHSMSPN